MRTFAWECLCLTGLLLLAGLASQVAAADRPNVLFIAIDDLNHWVGHLGRNPQTKTPNIDRLAAAGVTFTKANCAAPACNPSRAALMSGLRPSTTGVYDNGQNWRPAISEDKLLNTFFLQAGYRVFGAGKIYHGSYGHGGAWTDYFAGGSSSLQRHPAAKDDGVGGIQFYPLANSDEEMPDYKVVDYGLAKLKEQHDQPFFLAIGLVKPHMPFSVPKKYYDMFPLESIELPPHRDDDLNDIPPAGIRMAKPDGDHAQILQSGRWKEAVQAYLATIAFCDAQVGRLLDGLERSAYRDNTMVVLWSDHGWHLGEKQHWRKFALWEEAARTVFIWKVPGLTRPGGICERPVDFMSIYPTLCDLAGLERPAHVEGQSIRALLEDPAAAWEASALTTFHKDNHSLRSERFRYIRYADGSEELYDHQADPYGFTNLAGDAKFAAVKAELGKFIPRVNVDELPRVGGGEPQKKKAGANKKKAKAAS